MIPLNFSLRDSSPISWDGSDYDSDDIEINWQYSILQSSYLTLRNKSRVPNQKTLVAFHDLHRFVLLHPDVQNDFQNLLWSDLKVYTKDYQQIRKETLSEFNSSLKTIAIALDMILKIFPSFSNYPPLREVTIQNHFSFYLEEYQKAILTGRKDQIDRTYQNIKVLATRYPQFEHRIPKNPYILPNIFLPGIMNGVKKS